jgi:hypothetical protein
MLGMEIRDKVAAYVCERIGEHALSRAGKQLLLQRAGITWPASETRQQQSYQAAWCQPACVSSSAVSSHMETSHSCFPSVKAEHGPQARHASSSLIKQHGASQRV